MLLLKTYNCKDKIRPSVTNKQYLTWECINMKKLVIDQYWHFIFNENKWWRQFQIKKEGLYMLCFVRNWWMFLAFPFHTCFYCKWLNFIVLYQRAFFQQTNLKNLTCAFITWIDCLFFFTLLWYCYSLCFEGHANYFLVFLVHRLQVVQSILMHSN